MSETSLARLRRYAYWLDSGIPLPGLPWRIGFDSLLGLVPGVGDATGALLGGWILIEAARLKVSAATLARLFLNLALDATVGSIPLLGDLFDFVWKSNQRNLAILERHQHDPARAGRADRVFVAVLLVALALICVVPVVVGVFLAGKLFGIFF